VGWNPDCIVLVYLTPAWRKYVIFELLWLKVMVVDRIMIVVNSFCKFYGAEGGYIVALCFCLWLCLWLWITCCFVLFCFVLFVQEKLCLHLFYAYVLNELYRCSGDKIRRDGQRALRLLSDNVDLIVLLRYSYLLVLWYDQSPWFR
jgi:hypothetical protein